MHIDRLDEQNLKTAVDWLATRDEALEKVFKL